MAKNVFKPADILLPRDITDKWSVVACDQFSAQRDYWEDVEKYVGNAPSTLRMILPEAYLNDNDTEKRAFDIDDTMVKYLQSDVFAEYPGSFVYVERATSAGVRRGLVGALDLDQYDYTPGANAAIRASENTVVARLPARVKVRRRAAVELPHIMALIDDADKALIEPLADKKDSLKCVYDFDLIKGGGHIAGWLIDGAEAQALADKFNDLFSDRDVQVIMGDGNHSLAAAKTYWDEIKVNVPESERDAHPAHYALVEINNVYDDAIVFEAIHRAVLGTDDNAAMEYFIENAPKKGSVKYDIVYHNGDKTGTVEVFADSVGDVIGKVQKLCDEITDKFGGETEYIHGADTLVELAANDGNFGVILPDMGKSDFFKTVTAGGMFPKKSFSIGHAEEKRYYLECRKIR